MPRRKLIRPAEPLTPPEPGSLEETIYLGDCASAYTNHWHSYAGTTDAANYKWLFKIGINPLNESPN